MNEERNENGGWVREEILYGSRRKFRFMSADGEPRFWSFKLLRHTGVDVVISPISQDGFSSLEQNWGRFSWWDTNGGGAGIESSVFRGFRNFVITNADPVTENNVGITQWVQSFVVHDCGVFASGIDVWCINDTLDVDSIHLGRPFWDNNELLLRENGHVEFSVSSSSGGRYYYNARLKNIIQSQSGVGGIGDNDGFEQLLFGFRTPLLANRIKQVRGKVFNRVDDDFGLSDVTFGYQGMKMKGVTHGTQEILSPKFAVESILANEMPSLESTSCYYADGKVEKVGNGAFESGFLFDYLSQDKIRIPGESLFIRQFVNSTHFVGGQQFDDVVGPDNLISADIFFDWHDKEEF